RAEGSAQEPASGRRKPGVLDLGGQHRADDSLGGGGRPADRGTEKKKGMNARIAAVLVVLLAVVGGGALLYYQKERSRSPANAGTQVEFDAADGKALAKLVVARKYFRREVENAEKASADGLFVMLPADPKTVLIVSDPLGQASARSADWLDRRSFKVEKLRSLE